MPKSADADSTRGPSSADYPELLALRDKRDAARRSADEASTEFRKAAQATGLNDAELAGVLGIRRSTAYDILKAANRGQLPVRPSRKSGAARDRDRKAQAERAAELYAAIPADDVDLVDDGIFPAASS